ncbi:TPA: tlde1 domain-containing protein [Raoultella planticola]
MADNVFVNGVDRGSFRLHPLRPNGEGESWGCITFYNILDFQLVRKSLLARKKIRVPGGKELMAYGRIDVTGRADYASCKVKK